MPVMTNAAKCSLTLVWTPASDEAFCAAFTAQVNHSHSSHHDITAFPPRRAIDINCVVVNVFRRGAVKVPAATHICCMPRLAGPILPLTVNYDKTSLCSTLLNMCIGALRS